MINKSSNSTYFKSLKILFIILLFYPSISFAEYKWKKIGSNIDGDVYYVDLLSIKKVGDNAYFFNLTDYIKPTKHGDLSSKVYQEYNCLDYSFRYLKDFYYEKPMGNGVPSATSSELSEWYDSPRGSISAIMAKFVCNYK